jgi:hypothetical protein
MDTCIKHGKKIVLITKKLENNQTSLNEEHKYWEKKRTEYLIDEAEIWMLSFQLNCKSVKGDNNSLEPKGATWILILNPF